MKLYYGTILRLWLFIAFLAYFLCMSLLQYKSATFLKQLVIPSTIPLENNSTNFWDHLDNYKLMLYKHVAYFDNRTFPPKMRLLAFKLQAPVHSGSCWVRNQTFGKWNKVPAIFDQIRINWGIPPKIVTGHFFILCPVTEMPREIFFGLENPSLENSSVIRHIILVERPKKESANLATCTSSLFQYNDWMRLVIFIEVYRFHGAEKLILYNESTSRDTDKVLRYYQANNVIDLISWLPYPRPPKFISAGGFYSSQILTLNDCILRTSGHFKYVVIADIDELISVEGSDSNKNQSSSFLQLIENSFSEGVGGIEIQSAYAEINNWSEVPQKINENLTVKNVRIPNFFENVTRFPIEPPRFRNKLVVKPELVEKQSVHSAWRYLNDHKEALIKPEKMLLYHFRNEPYDEPGDRVETVSPFASMRNQLEHNIKRAVQGILRHNYQ